MAINRSLVLIKIEVNLFLAVRKKQMVVWFEVKKDVRVIN